MKMGASDTVTTMTDHSSRSFFQSSETHVRFCIDSAALRSTEDGDSTAGRAGGGTNSPLGNHSQGRKVVFVVDNSGSMSSAYAQVKAGLRYIVESCSETTKPEFILYNSTATRVSGEVILNSRVTGCTSFGKAFEAIRNYVLGDTPPQTKVAVVFMTDGHDTATKDLKMEKQLFSTFLQNSQRDVVVHTIGFTQSHSQKFLEEIRLMGTSEGVYRYAEGKDNLAERFHEIFDFLSTTLSVSVRIPGITKPISVDADLNHDPTTGVDGWTLDVTVPRPTMSSTFTPENSYGQDTCDVHVLVNNKEVCVSLPRVEANHMFTIKMVENMEIQSPSDLDRAQQMLSDVNPFKAPKGNRSAVSDARADVQAKLDAYHTLFAQIARGSTTGQNIASQLSSLRHEAKFSKSRRARSMDKRVRANAERVVGIEQHLSALPTPTFEEGGDNHRVADLTCPLSADTFQEVMLDSKNDFMVFALRVTRPEHVIDAPTQLVVEDVRVGTYSHDAFQTASKFSIQQNGGTQAHGGFVQSRPGKSRDPLGNTTTASNASNTSNAADADNENDVTTTDEVGLFKGPDGEMMNACLPLFLSPDHWARVEAQINPILGYFFTLDPLGFKGDQQLAMFSVLGQLINLRANGRFRSEWADYIIGDLTRVCEHLRPKAIKYLLGGNYTGVSRGDILEDFLAGPGGRIQDALPNLMIIIGWEHVIKTACGTTTATTNTTTNDNDTATQHRRFLMAFTEEFWRRAIARVFRHHTSGESVERTEMLATLILEPEVASVNTSTPATDVEETEAERVHCNKPLKEKQFGVWAKYKFKELSKKQMENVRRSCPVAGPKVEDDTTNLAIDHSDATNTARPGAQYDDHPDHYNAAVDRLLHLIRDPIAHATGLYDGCVTGSSFTPRERWLMMIQALQYSSNAIARKAVQNDTYVNTHDAVDDLAAVVRETYSEYKRKKEEKGKEAVTAMVAWMTAKRIMKSKDPYAFAGRMMVSCPTRGGDVFNNCVKLLCNGVVDGVPIPNLVQKIRLFLTGRLRLTTTGEHTTKSDRPVLANGEAWIHCTAEVADDLREVVGRDAFATIEVSMHGHWGWVYRMSDLPNRHGYHNSRPNPSLASSFTGFNLV
eukprot:TRINITY_DN4715_c0_g3_i1.p1 TRINITY_DN4715_c0_g3~~TRINITY_DN4715_c0_g3_i1.p1  ORF type:complete len:1115 (+),score=263.30 TRINITY_DN4715_c0_g3_i1:437-3781(+)